MASIMTSMLPVTVKGIDVDLGRRFWSKVDVAGLCWLWTSATDSAGYAVYWVGDGHSRRAHRLAYRGLVGPIPDGLTLDHLCRVHNCVNPDHLEPVTAGENVRRAEMTPMAVKARQTHCMRGHEFTRANTYVRPHGRRECRRCNADRERQRYRDKTCPQADEWRRGA